MAIQNPLNDLSLLNRCSGIKGNHDLYIFSFQKYQKQPMRKSMSNVSILWKWQVFSPQLQPTNNAWMLTPEFKRFLHSRLPSQFQTNALPLPSIPPSPCRNKIAIVIISYHNLVESAPRHLFANPSGCSHEIQKDPKITSHRDLSMALAIPRTHHPPCRPLGHVGQDHGVIHGGLLCCLDVEWSDSVCLDKKNFYYFNSRLGGRLTLASAEEWFFLAARFLVDDPSMRASNWTINLCKTWSTGGVRNFKDNPGHFHHDSPTIPN